MNELIEGEWQTGKRSIACYKREIKELKQQRDDLLAACELALEFFAQRDIQQKVISGLSLQLLGAIKKVK